MREITLMQGKCEAYLPGMDFGRIFFQRGNSGFFQGWPKDFSRGDNNGEISFCQFETERKTVFLLKS